MRASVPGQSALLLLDVIDVLNERHIPYAIVGAFAASFYGVVRASLDADALVSIPTSQEVSSLCDVLRAKTLTVEHRRGDQGDPIAAVINIQDQFSNRVDLLLGIRGMNEDAFQRVEKAQFMGSVIKIIGRESFVAMKIFAGSPKDIQDVMGVLDVSGQKINLALLKKLTARHGARCLKKLAAILKERRKENSGRDQ